MNKKFFDVQSKRILIILGGLIGTIFLWTGGIGAGRLFSGLPTSSTLTTVCSITGLFLVAFISSYAATNVRDDE